MANELPTPIDMGFAEFTAQLIAETFDAIIASNTAQDERSEEILALVGLSLDEFAVRTVTDAEVEGSLRLLFPQEDGERRHAVFVGAPYRRGTAQAPEDPPFESLLGVRLESGDVSRDKALTKLGVAKVVSAARSRLAATRQLALQRLVAQGVPRIVIDSGRIRAKLTFQVELLDEERAARESGPPGASTPPPVLRHGHPLIGGVLKPLHVTGLAHPFTPPNVRLLVRQVDDRAPQTTQVRADIYSEVEITFKTVT